MDGERQAYALFLLLALTLPVAALVSRRPPAGRTLAIAGAWVAIFILGMLIVGLGRDRLGQSWASVRTLLGDDEQRVSGRTVRLRMAPDGHFWARVSVNGIERRMLVDSGATTTSLSLQTAQAADVDIEQSPYPVQIQTANGVVLARTANVATISLGPIIASDLRVVVAQQFGNTDVLGMNFLSRLQSWKVEGRTLVLEPRHQ